MSDNSSKTGRNQDGTWPKGVTGNPHGRPKSAKEFKEALQAMAERNIKDLEALKDNTETPPAVRAKILEYLVDRGYGRPAQEIVLGGSVKIPIVFDKMLDDDKT